MTMTENPPSTVNQTGHTALRANRELLKTAP